jgi:hypothetical protein
VETVKEYVSNMMSKPREGRESFARHPFVRCRYELSG